MSILDDITDKAALARELYPNGILVDGDVLQVAGKGPEPGRSARVFMDTGIVYDFNGRESYDLVTVAKERWGVDDRDVTSLLRVKGYLPQPPSGAEVARLKALRKSPQAPKDKNPLRPVQNCSHVPEDLSQADFYRMPAWVPARGKKKLVPSPWKFSLSAVTGGTVRIARFGGPIAPVGDRPAGQALPWMSRDDCLAAISAEGLKDSIPTFCLTGDPDCPASHDILVLDCDYKPHLDPDELGSQARDMVAAGMASAGAAVFASTSGNGRHIVCRLTLEDILNGKRHYAGLPTKDAVEGPQDTDRTPMWHGLRIEIFPAGTKRHIIWHINRKLDGPDDEAPLGRVGLRDVALMIGDAMDAAEDAAGTR